MRQMILNDARKACNEAHSYMKTFATYEHIWSDDEENAYWTVYPAANGNSVESLCKCDYIVGIAAGDNVHVNDATYSFQNQVCGRFFLRLLLFGRLVFACYWLATCIFKTFLL